MRLRYFSLFGFGVSAAVASAQFTNGNLAVVLVGDGTATLNSTAAKTQVIEINRSTGAATGQAFDLTFNASTRQNGITLTGNSLSEGGLNAYQGKAVLGGYSAAVGTGSLGNLSTKRVVRVDYVTGAISSFSDFIAAGNIRSVATANGTDYYAAMSTGGVMKGTVGNFTPTFVSGTDTNIRFINVDPASGQLYYSINGAGGGFAKSVNAGNAPIFSTAANSIGIADFALSYTGLELYIAADAGTAAGFGPGVYRIKRNSSADVFNPANAVKIYGSAARYLSLYQTGSTTSVYVTRRPSGTSSSLTALDGADTATGLITPSWDFASGSNTVYMGSEIIQTVPEPATMAVLGLGLAGLAARRRRK